MMLDVLFPSYALEYRVSGWYWEAGLESPPQHLPLSDKMLTDNRVFLDSETKCS